MLNETEIKLKIPYSEMAESVMNRCKVLSNNQFDFESQKDVYFDTSTVDLQKNDIVIRFRKLNDKKFIALKSPRVFITDTIQKRIELEFEVFNETTILDKINKQGLKPTATIEKRRYSFYILDCNVVIDELPFIGWFIEIEGESVPKIENAIQFLHLDSMTRVKLNYGELLDNELSKLGLSLRPNLCATFESYEKWKNND